jgi:ribosomal protein L16/L10AE
MSKVSGDRALGGHILADMSMQAHHQHHAQEALALADAAVAAARSAGPTSALARCHAVRARALALLGDANGSDQALNNAERALARANTNDEPFWIRFFTPQQLASESMYVAADLGRAGHVRRHARTAFSTAGGMQRRQVLAAATLAASHLPTQNATSTISTDVDKACGVLRDVLPVIGSLTSARALTSINTVRGRLAAFSDRPAVRRLERDLQLAMTAA